MNKCDAGGQAKRTSWYVSRVRGSPIHSGAQFRHIGRRRRNTQRHASRSHDVFVARRPSQQAAMRQRQDDTPQEPANHRTTTTHDNLTTHAQSAPSTHHAARGYTQNAERRTQNAERRTQSAERRAQNADKTQTERRQNAERVFEPNRQPTNSSSNPSSNEPTSLGRLQGHGSRVTGHGSQVTGWDGRDGRTDGCVDGWMRGWMDGWMAGSSRR